MPLMAKKKKKTLYVEIDADLKDWLDQIAAAHSRKLTAEVEMALRRYLKEEQAKLPPPEDDKP
jgi:predicted transcriptional regulator